jgi:UMF1 family MFS transporter
LTNQSQKNPNRKQIFIWTLFDFANTSYAIVVITFLFAVYFKQTIAEGKPIGDLYWSLGTSISMLVTALISPVLGAIADYSSNKKKFLLFFTVICLTCTALLYFTGQGDVFLALLLFIFSNIGFEAGLVFYDAFLPEITAPKNYGRVSGYGYAMGYLGSLASLAIAYPFIQNEMIKETFPVSALFFLVFALPIFLFLKEKKVQRNKEVSFLRVGFARVANTIKNLKHYRDLAWYLVAFFFYIEGVNTVIYFSGIYANTTLGFTISELILFFLIVQSTAIFGSVIFGIISDSYGQKKTIVLSLIIWIFTILLAYFSSGEEMFIAKFFSEKFEINSLSVLKNSFYVVGLLAGSVMGATQSVSRSLMSKLTPEEKKTEFFGFYSFFGKSSAILGPLVFGLVSFIFESQRPAILSIALFFVIGLFLLTKVNDPKTEEIAA